ncbi:hypothetical protein KBZ10_10855 [Streptomyces sp. F63]|uniref:hypothetical protein n=1 Tax=Streptomyces sp. F63 TaxID=2824887 RepID=UPI001B38C541|nr:hypothetical protein [Streptomyces sp. F63]MBQ0985007.1 hypothetical protein [Streptomyces sp. F63]
MSETQTETSAARPHMGTAQASSGPGKHRGPAASEDAAAPAHGRHRRPSPEREA